MGLLSLAPGFVPWWAWVVAGLIVLALTLQLWLPVWSALPLPVKIAIGVICAVLLAYLAGLNRGAAAERDSSAAKIEQMRRAAAAAAEARDDTIKTTLEGRYVPTIAQLESRNKTLEGEVERYAKALSTKVTDKCALGTGALGLRRHAR